MFMLETRSPFTKRRFFIIILNMKEKEVEIRFQVSPEQKRVFLEFITKKHLAVTKTEQQDEYFCAAELVKNKQSHKAKYILRIRQSKDRAVLAYKAFTGDGSWMEIESAISSPQAIIEILENIGQKKYLNIHKHRLSVKYNKFEINFDSITNLGDFIEIECFSSNVATAQKLLFSFAKNNFGISKKAIVKEGYVQLMEKKYQQNP